jgi:hypothetical protein
LTVGGHPDGSEKILIIQRHLWRISGIQTAKVAVVGRAGGYEAVVEAWRLAFSEFRRGEAKLEKAWNPPPMRMGDSSGAS